MNGNGLRWMPLCITATTSALLAASAGSHASASQKHKLKHGESVSAVARKFHVSIRAIAAANPGIDVDSVPDGHMLVIPSVSSKSVVHKATSAKSHSTKMSLSKVHLASGHHKIGYTRGDNVGVRGGPGETFKRIGASYKGQKLVVSAIKDGWAHVTVKGGRSGWMRHDFVKYEPSVAVTKLTAHHKKAKRAEAVAAAKHRAHAEHIAALAKHTHKKHAVQLAQPHLSKHHPASHTASREHNREGDSSVVGTAIAYRGTPYRYGSTGGGSFDCSGFTRFVYSRKGVALPHSAKEQFHAGHGVSRGDMKPGDLVFFHTVTSGISHVGIYAGDGKFVHASSRRSGGVRVDRLDSGYYSSAFRGARRVK